MRIVDRYGREVRITPGGPEVRRGPGPWAHAVGMLLATGVAWSLSGVEETTVTKALIVVGPMALLFTVGMLTWGRQAADWPLGRALALAVACWAVLLAVLFLKF